MDKYSCATCVCRECSRRTSKNCASCPYCGDCDGRLCWNGQPLPKPRKESWLHRLVAAWSK